MNFDEGCVGSKEQFQKISVVGKRIVLPVCSTGQRRVLISLLCCDIWNEGNEIFSSSLSINTAVLDEEGT